MSIFHKKHNQINLYFLISVGFTFLRYIREMITQPVETLYIKKSIEFIEILNSTSLFVEKLIALEHKNN